MKDLIEDSEAATGVEHSVDDRADEDAVTTLGYFDGMFFRIDLVINVPPLPRSRHFN
jgi:hypothetical protein